MSSLVGSEVDDKLFHEGQGVIINVFYGVSAVNSKKFNDLAGRYPCFLPNFSCLLGYSHDYR